MGGYFDSDSASTGDASGGIQFREDVYNFFTVPKELERILLYGFLICFDSFLFLFTFFPIRVAYAVAHLIKKLVLPKSTKLGSSEIYDLLRATIILLVYFALTATDASVMYHFIRGQAAIKLYVIFNVLEIFDRLCCSFGQDILDALFLLGVPEEAEERKKFSPIVSFVIAAVYVFLHSIFLFIKVVTLNAAVNAYSNALLTLLVSNNFVELKGSVFKNFKEENLFQITCSDMVERFQLFIFLGIIMAHNLNDISWSLTRETLEGALWVILTVWAMEVLVDWIKHAFITKFNRINSDVYSKFSKIIATEIVRTKRHAIPDTSHNISRRIGFVPLPLACVVLRVFLTVAPIEGLLGALWLFAFWASLCVLKVITTLMLLGKSLKRLESDREKTADRTEKILANTFAYEKI
jgi:transmembrane anterior posterior transformation protein 1